jgi:hypothetical protein
MLFRFSLYGFHVGDPASAATVLSLESQATGAAAIVLAPLLGVLVEAARVTDWPAHSELWPVAAVGLLACIAVLVTPART